METMHKILIWYDIVKDIHNNKYFENKQEFIELCNTD